MESRSAWTDKRLDDRFDHIDSELAQLRAEMRQLRVEMRQGFAELRAEIGDLRAETRAEIDSLRSTMVRFGASINVGLVGVIAAVLLRGA